MNGNAIQGLLYLLCMYGKEKSKMSKMIVMFQAFVFWGPKRVEHHIFNQWLIVGLGCWFGILRSPYKRDYYIYHWLLGFFHQQYFAGKKSPCLDVEGLVFHRNNPK